MKKIFPLTFWCHKVIPLVYDNSLSYYETLCKVRHILNEVIKQLELTEEEIEALENYIENNLGEIVSKELNKMLQNGQLSVAFKNKTNYYDLGELSNFRIAYRTPSIDERDRIIAECITEKAIYAQYQWVYYTESPDYKNEPNTIPLYNPDNPEEVYNVNGKGTSCSTTLCNVLYNIGYTDLKGVAKWADARVKEYSFPEYLQSKNWIPITDKSQLIQGDIVFVGYANYNDERQYNPSHCFVYNGYVSGKMTAYDFGNTTYIQNNSINDFVWDITTPQTQEVVGGALFRCYANADMRDVGDNLWVGESYEGDNGEVFQRIVNTENLYVLYHTKKVNRDNTVSWSYQRFPVSSYNTWRGITVYVKVYESGAIGFKMNGTLDSEIGNLSGPIDYTIFSFNTFANYKFINDVFNDTFTVDGKTVRVGTVTENNITTVHLYMDSETVAAGTEIHYHRTMYLR